MPSSVPDRTDGVVSRQSRSQARNHTFRNRAGRQLPSAVAATLSRLFRQHTGLLSAPIEEDSFLTSAAGGLASHQFLAKSAQCLSGRQVAFLSAVLRDYRPGLPSTIQVLDWGCGKGHITYLLRKYGFSVTSCDIVTEKDDSSFGQDVPIIREQNISVVPLHHPSELPFPSDAFDCVVSFGVLEHVQSDIRSLEEVRRVLKPGGIFFVTLLPYFLSWTQALARLRGITYHDRLYHKRQLAAMAARAGFEAAGILHGQLFPKNSVPLRFDRLLEPIDRFGCRYTPLKYFATNVEAIFVAV